MPPKPTPNPNPAPPDDPGPPGNYTVQSGHPRIYWHDDIADRISAAPDVMSRVLDFAESDSTLTHVVIGRALWADTLGPAGSSGATYISSIEANTAALVDGFTSGAVTCRIDA